MKTAPAIDRDALRVHLREHYGLAARRLAFVPAGQGSYAYAVEAADGGRFFLKLLPLHGLGWTEQAHLDYYLQLARALAARGYPARPVAPRSAVTGALWTRFGGLPLVLYERVAGRHAGNPSGWADATLVAVAETLGQMHRDTAALAAEVPAVGRHAEAFGVGFEPGLWAAVEALEAGPRPGDGAAVAEAWADARATVPPLRGAIRVRLARLQALRARARAAHPDARRMVLCHTDINGENVLVDGDGAVALLDWEGAKLAPRELDVRYILDVGRLDLAVAAYERGAGPVRLDVDVLAFDLYRRPLFELAWYLGRALAPEAEPAQRAADLREAAEHARGWWYRGWWDEEDAGITAVAARLGAPPPGGTAPRQAR